MSMTAKEAEKLFEKLPKAELGFFPTPFYRLDRLSKELGVNLYIKRDDFTGMSLFGGNKVRKLQYLMGDAMSRGCEYVFTFGATQSNHAMQTAAACRRCGLKPVLYLVAIVKPDEEDLRANLLLDRIMDAEVHIVEIQAKMTTPNINMGKSRCFIASPLYSRCWFLFLPWRWECCRQFHG